MSHILSFFILSSFTHSISQLRHRPNPGIHCSPGSEALASNSSVELSCSIISEIWISFHSHPSLLIYSSWGQWCSQSRVVGQVDQQCRRENWEEGGIGISIWGPEKCVDICPGGFEEAFHNSGGSGRSRPGPREILLSYYNIFQRSLLSWRFASMKNCLKQNFFCTLGPTHLSSSSRCPHLSVAFF